MKLLFIVLQFALLHACSYKGSSEICDCTKNDASCNNCQGADFYWQMYYGEVPYDAVGADSESIYEPNTFIGLGLVIGDGIFPGVLHRKTSIVKVSGLETIHTISENVMILCSKNKINFSWKKVNITDVSSWSNSSSIKLVGGGFQREQKLFIGRLYDDEGILQVGKVFPHPPMENAGFYYVKNDAIAKRVSEFEILLYADKN